MLERLVGPLLLNLVTIHFMVNTLHPVMRQWLPSRHSCSLEQDVWCTCSLAIPSTS